MSKLTCITGQVWTDDWFVFHAFYQCQWTVNMWVQKLRVCKPWRNNESVMFLYMWLYFFLGDFTHMLAPSFFFIGRNIKYSKITINLYFSKIMAYFSVSKAKIMEGIHLKKLHFFLQRFLKFLLLTHSYSNMYSP